MYLIVGRTGSGKTYLAELLKQRGLRPVISHTTRPPRHPGEDSYIFVSEDEAENCEDKLIETEINGYTYYVTKDDLKNKDFYVIDPIGAKRLISIYETMADENFNPERMLNIVYIVAPYEYRYYQATHRIGGYLPSTFHKRDESETEQFFAFEENIASIIRCNLVTDDLLIIRNMYEPEHFEQCADDIARKIKRIDSNSN